MKRRKVSILSYTASGNALGRAWVFAELLREHFDVELIASARREAKVWAPLRDQHVVDRRWFVRTWPAFRLRAAALAEQLVTGDLVVAVKPRIQTLGLALAAKQVRPRPVLLDIDDWELGFYSPWWDSLCAPLSWFTVASNLHTRWYFRRTEAADAITVSSRFLQQRFGGMWLPHARRDDGVSTVPLSARPLVMFAGTPRPHKGLDDLCVAFRRVQRPDALLRIIGAAGNPALERLAAEDRRITLEPSVPLQDLPRLLATAWVVAIPQRDEAASRGQLPAKLMDAMALGKAIVATDVGDMPHWLNGDSGVVVPASDPPALGAALESLLADPARVSRLGGNARRRFCELGSYDAVRPRLLALAEDLLAGRKPAPHSEPFAVPSLSPGTAS
jgi:glycosyltransferase involved in cell wall biosynthesis